MCLSPTTASVCSSCASRTARTLGSFRFFSCASKVLLVAVSVRGDTCTPVVSQQPMGDRLSCYSLLQSFRSVGFYSLAPASVLVCISSCLHEPPEILHSAPPRHLPADARVVVSAARAVHLSLRFPHTSVLCFASAKVELQPEVSQDQCCTTRLKLGADFFDMHGYV